MTDTISWLEAVAWVVTFSSLLLLSWVVNLVVNDLDRLTRKKGFVRNGSLHLQAKGHIRTHGANLLSSVLYLFGISGLMFVPPRSDSGRGTLAQIAVSTVIFAIMSDLIFNKMLNAALYLRQRHLVIDMIEKEVDLQPRQPHNTRVIIETDGTGTLVSPVDVESRAAVESAPDVVVEERDERLTYGN